MSRSANNSSGRIKVHEFVAHSTAVTCLAFGSKSHQVLATGGEDAKVNIWRVGSAANIYSLGSNKSPIQSLCFDSEEHCVVSGAMNGSIKVFDLNVGKLARNVGGHQVNTCAIQYHPHGEFLISGSTDSSVKMWDVRNKTCIQTYSGHEGEITCVRFCPDGRWAASSAKDGTLLIWDLVAGKLMKSLKLSSPACINSFEFHPEYFVLAAATSMRTVRVWDLESAETIEIFNSTPADYNPIRGVAFSPDGSVVYSATKDSLKAWYWDPTIKLQDTVSASWDKVSDLKLSKSNHLIAGSFNCNFVSVWSLDLNEGNNEVPNNNNNNLKAQPKSVAESNRSEEKKIASNSPRGVVSSSSAAGVSGGSNNANNNNNNNNRKAPTSASSGAKTDYGSDHSENPQVSPRDAKMNVIGAAYKNDNAQKATDTAKEISRILNNSGNKSKWESSEEASRDMATSIGESFWKKYKEEREKLKALGINPQEVEEAVKEDEEDEEYTDDFEDNKIGNNIGNNKGTSASNAHDNNDAGHHEKVMSNLEHLKLQAQGRPELVSRIQELQAMLPAPTASPFFSEDKHTPLNNDPAPVRRRSLGSDEKRDSALSMDDLSSNNSNNNHASDYPLPQGGRRDKKAVVSTNEAHRGRVVTTSPPTASDNDSTGLEIQGHRHGKLVDQRGPDPLSILPAARVGTALSSNRANRVGGGGPSGGPQKLRDPSPKVPDSGTADSPSDAIDKLTRQSGSLSSQLTLRLSGMRMLRRMWDKNNADDVLDHLRGLSENLSLDPSQSTLIGDFLETIDVRVMATTLDNCIVLLRVIEAVLGESESLKSTSTVESMLACLTFLLETFGQLIRSTRSLMTVGAVDISREERLRKCNICYDILYRLRGKMDQLKHHFRKNAQIVRTVNTAFDLIDDTIA